MVSEPRSSVWWILLGFVIFMFCDLNVVNVTSFVLALNINFARKFSISNVVDVFHLSMNIGTKIWCHVFGDFRPN